MSRNELIASCYSFRVPKNQPLLTLTTVLVENTSFGIFLDDATFSSQSHMTLLPPNMVEESWQQHHNKYGPAWNTTGL